MNNLELQRLERMARLLPPRSLNLAKTNTMFGPLYLAWGEHAGSWYGVWAIRGIAQTVEFRSGVDESVVRHVLVHCAMTFAADMSDARLYQQPGRFDA